MKVLVTCGPTWVPIDDVRVISNVSSGEMGHFLARAFRFAGAHVTIIEGPVTHTLADKKIKVIKYRFFDELSGLLRQELSKKYDIIVHAAAVSDFKVVGTSKSKIPSDKSLILKLTPAPKLIKEIKRLSPKIYLIGFKLESNMGQEAIDGVSTKKIKSLFTEALCDLVVANSLKDGYRGFIVNPDGKILGKASNKQKMAQAIVKTACRAVVPDN